MAKTTNMPDRMFTNQVRGTLTRVSRNCSVGKSLGTSCSFMCLVIWVVAKPRTSNLLVEIGGKSDRLYEFDGRNLAF